MKAVRLCALLALVCVLAGEADAVCNERVGFGGWGLSVDQQLDSLAIPNMPRIQELLNTHKD